MPAVAVAAPRVPDAATPSSASASLSPQAAALSADPNTAAERFWTPERIAAAKPADRGVTLDQVRRTAQTSLLGKVSVGGQAPSSAAAGKVTTLAGGTGTSWPRRHDWVSMTNGKVLYEDNGLWHCSGVVVTTEARNTVFTAGHCVHGGKGGGWHDRNWTFIPDYYYNDRPAGTWTARQLWALNGWINDSNNSYDIGAAVMHPRNGQKLMDVTGSQGIRINGPSTPSVWHFGFPLNSPFDGEDLINCDGPTSLRFGFFGDLKMACTMQGGASGGAWLADFNQNWGYTVSVNSYHVGDDLTQIYGPYFGDGAKNLYDTVRNLG
ncbi:trypsin-like serine peptidase [Lentzea guizhouensis]|uniref:trypsin-like serine peptidase n=1 Tax=Lentzea guizhouensis TaxID=1586287 RepID=UPI0012B6870D|nr:hypothetical protein [Lentzea guizhouensis]